MFIESRKPHHRQCHTNPKLGSSLENHSILETSDMSIIPQENTNKNKIDD